jgi:hypothetical protein
MKHKVLITISVIAVSFATIFTLHYSPEPNLSVQQSAIESNKNIPVIDMKPIQTLSTGKNVLPITDKSNSTTQEQLDKPEQQVLTAEVFSDEFVSTENGKEFVSKKALDDVFKNDTSLLLQRMSDIEYSEVAQIRKDKLNEFIINELKDVTILQQDLECAGKVCAIELTYTQSSNQASIDTLSSFSKNYSFQQFTETESGDKKLKALYIATDNPSGLSLSDS